MVCQSFGIIDLGQRMVSPKTITLFTRAVGTVFLALIVLQSSESAYSADTSTASQHREVRSDWLTTTGQGFDTCEIPTTTEMQDWRSNGPYVAVNLYIGGSARACANTSLTSAFVAELESQGWKFIPTWVGPQAACSIYASRMSIDAATAYNQGVAEARSAATAAADLSLLNSVIYYDLEAYDTGNTNCRNAADSFVSGWTGALKAFGHQTGVYGATCSSAVSDFAGLANVPDVLWAAIWLDPAQYRADASVFGLRCLSDTLWVNHQRIRQYAGGHDELWGSTTLNIDSSVIDGVVAKQDPPCPASGGVILYWNANYDCSSTTADPGYRSRSNIGWQNVHDGQFNDQASSLRKPPAWSVRVFVDAYRGGASTCFNGNVSNFSTLGNFPGTSIPLNDSISSFEVFNANNCVNAAYQYIFPLIKR